MNTARLDQDDNSSIEAILIQGDLSSLTPAQRYQYANRVCETLGLNPLTGPLAYIKLNGKLVLYCKRDATDQLRKLHRVSVQIRAREQLGDVYVVTAQASTPDSRADESVGAVNTAGLKGDALANALMKAETKAKRRVTLSICGLGMLDETEVETVRGAKLVTESETSQPTEVPNAVIEDVPATESEAAYVIPFGKFRGRSLEAVERGQLASYCEFLARKAREQGRELRGQAKEFIDRAQAFLSLEAS